MEEKQKSEKDIKKSDDNHFLVAQKDGTDKPITDFETVEVYEILAHLKREADNINALLNPITCPDEKKQENLKEYLETLKGAIETVQKEFDLRPDKKDYVPE